MGLGSTRSYSEDVAHLPAITDPDLHKAFKNLMAAGWNDLPNSLISEVKSALSKNSDDKAGKEVVANVFRAAEAIEEFGAIVMNLKMELDDAVGASGEVFLRAWIDNPMFSLSILSGSREFLTF